MTVRLLTLLSDFGSGSPYAAAMKAVVAARVAAQMIDISHDVPRHDVRQGAFLLASVAPFCPAGTVHLAVVDPGVGTARRPLVVTAGGQSFVGPDNGLLLPAARRLGTVRAFLLDPAVGLATVSTTFHGRDLFAPAAARLLRGDAPSRLGQTIDDPVDLLWTMGRWDGSFLVGEVLYIDPFGNLTTNIPAELVAPGTAFTLQTPRGPRRVRSARTYADGPRSVLLLVLGGEGLLEVAVREGDAAARTGLRPRSPVRLRPVTSTAGRTPRPTQARRRRGTSA